MARWMSGCAIVVLTVLFFSRHFVTSAWMQATNGQPFSWAMLGTVVGKIAVAPVGLDSLLMLVLIGGIIILRIVLKPSDQPPR